jgi:hypothetical protein
MIPTLPYKKTPARVSQSTLVVTHSEGSTMSDMKRREFFTLLGGAAMWPPGTPRGRLDSARIAFLGAAGRKEVKRADIL